MPLHLALESKSSNCSSFSDRSIWWKSKLWTLMLSWMRKYVFFHGNTRLIAIVIITNLFVIVVIVMIIVYLPNSTAFSEDEKLMERLKYEHTHISNPLSGNNFYTFRTLFVNPRNCHHISHPLLSPSSCYREISWTITPEERQLKDYIYSGFRKWHQNVPFQKYLPTSQITCIYLTLYLPRLSEHEV